MLGRLFLLFTLVPLIELYLLVTLGGAIGLWPTLALVCVTGVAGAALAKREGMRVLRDWQSSLARGEVPRDGLMGSVMVLVGGILLVTPGVLTDLTGLALLFPPTRRAIARMVSHRLQKRIDVHVHTAVGPAIRFGTQAAAPSMATGPIIDLDADGVREKPS